MPLPRPLGFAVLALSLACAAPALAQNTIEPPLPPPPSGASTEHGAWDNESFERQEFREEMEQIRKEHDDLEDARDRLLDKCVNTTAQQAAVCNAEKEVLHERRVRVHDRVVALREKIDAARKEREAKTLAHQETGPQPVNPPPATPAAK